MAAVRYIVSDIAACVAYYRDVLDFEIKIDAAPRFAALTRDGLTLFLNIPGAGSAGKAGGHPEPGGWNRFQIETGDLEASIEELKAKGAEFRGEIAEGAGRQILLIDPSGNLVEVFEPPPRS